MKRFVKDNLPLLVLICFLANLVVILIYETTRKPRVILKVQRFQPVTNYIASVSCYTNVISATNLHSSLPAASYPDLVSYYDYFETDQGSFAYLWDRYYTAGSLTSRGEILVIFPDRLQFSSGQWLVNSKYSAASVKTSAPLERSPGDSSSNGASDSPAPPKKPTSFLGL